MEVIRPKVPDGQHFVLREYLRLILAAAPFEGEAWTACTKAFLAYRAIPVLGSNFTTLAPASYLLDLYENREPDFGSGREGYWGEEEFRRKLLELGDQKLQQLVATDESRSWAIYLSEDLKAIVGFHGRLKPGPRFGSKDYEQDLAEAKVVRGLIPRGPAKIDRIDLSDFTSVKVEVTAGQRFELTFSGCHWLQHPAPGNETVEAIEEAEGRSGRRWFVFRGPNNAGRAMAIQAENVEVRQL